MRKIATILAIAVASIHHFAGLSAPAYAADDPKSSAGATVLADSGFRPKPAGFSFENWGGDQYPYSDLTANDAVALFGEQVCARWNGDKCIPTPAAKVWLQEMNQMMKGGHCEGMAALSAAFYAKQENPSDYGAKQAFELSPKDKELMSSISTYFATQALEPVQSVTASTRDFPLQKIIDTLIGSLKAGKDYPTLGIYGPDGGHAVTPYMVQQLADGSYRIFVYDNNYPGSEKWIDVDPRRDMWVYAGAALNPKEDPAPWQGGGGSMDITFLSTRYEPLACPFCGGHKPPKAPAAPPPASPHPRKPAKQPDSFSVITPNRCSQVQATRKSDKKQIAASRKGKKNEIPGATMTSLRGTRGCYVRLPANAQYDISLVDDGLPLIAALTDLFVFGAGNAYGVSNVALSPSTIQLFVIGSSGLSYQAGGSQKPTMVIASDRSGPNSYYEVSGFTLRDGFQFNAEVSADGDVVFSDNDPELDNFDVSGEIVDADSTEDLELVDLSAGDKGDVELDLSENGEVDVDIDSDADGTEDGKDADDDNDGTPDAADNDDDNDGVADGAEADDEDFDGTPDAQDTDDDNDGTPDAQDADDDNDGTPDAQETDDDNDGTPDAQDTDDDNDGTPDAQDADDDNDGTPDEGEDDSAGDDQNGSDDAGDDGDAGGDDEADGTGDDTGGDDDGGADDGGAEDQGDDDSGHDEDHGGDDGE